jgi:hypothetical protein
MQTSFNFIEDGQPSKYPLAPGHKRDDTSKEAAISVVERAGILREAAFRLLLVRSLTADESAGRLGESVLSIRPRVSELVAAGRVVPTGDRRKNVSGKYARV